MTKKETGMEGGLHCCTQRPVGIDSLRTCPSVQDQRRHRGWS